MTEHSINPDVSIVIVSWRVRELLQVALTSIATVTEALHASNQLLRVETIVVDNDSGDGTVESVRAKFSTVRLIANAKNVGFTAANNQGLVFARGRYVLFLNSDAELVEDGLLRMVEFMDHQPYVGALGPRLENSDGTLQPSCRAFPTFWSAAAVLLKLQYLWPQALTLRRYLMMSFSYNTLRQVDQIMGAAMLVRRSLLTTLQGFDERFFLWFEEVDLCKRITAAGYIVMFFPWATVRHHRSSGFRQQRTLWRQWYFAQSCRRYFWKHRGPLAAVGVSVLSYISLFPALGLAAASRLGLNLKNSTQS